MDVQVGGGGENITDERLVLVGGGVVEGCWREGGLCGEGVEDGGEERTQTLVGCVQAAEGGGGEVVGREVDEDVGGEVEERHYGGGGGLECWRQRQSADGCAR